MQLRPSAALSLLLLPLAVLFVWLGQWQLERKQDKRQMLDSYAHAPQLEYSQAEIDDADFIRVQMSGHYLADWNLLLDNKIHNGRAGVHVVNLFQPDSGTTLLVNRGWLPMGPDRNHLPDIPLNLERVRISGMLISPPEDGVRLGEPENLADMTGTRLVTYLNMQEVQRGTDGQISPRLLQLDAEDASGFEGRDWKPAVITPAQHGAYAVQWFAMGLAIMIIWLSLSLKRGKGTMGHSAADRQKQGKRSQ